MEAYCEPLTLPELFQKDVGLGEILTVSSLALVKIRHRIQAHAIDTHLQPEIQHRFERFPDLGVVEVQVGLVRIKTMPKVGLSDGVPGPVRKLEVFEDDPRLLIFLLVVVPDVKVARVAAGFGGPRPLKPRVLIRSMINHQLGDDPDAALVGLVKKMFEVMERTVVRMDAVVIRDIIAVVFQRRGIKRQQPERRDSEILEVIEFFRKP